MVFTASIALIAAIIGTFGAAQILGALVLPSAILIGIGAAAFTYGFLNGQKVAARIGIPPLTQVAFNVGAAVLTGFLVYQFLVQALFGLGLFATAAVVIAVVVFGYAAVQGIVISAVRGMLQ